jgi:hypothetical protein
LQLRLCLQFCLCLLAHRPLAGPFLGGLSLGGALSGVLAPNVSHCALGTAVRTLCERKEGLEWHVKVQASQIDYDVFGLGSTELYFIHVLMLTW